MACIIHLPLNPESPRMRVKLQLVMCSDEDHEKTVTDVITLNKNHQRIEHLGLTLAECKQLLSTLQQHLLHQQVDTFLDTHSTCPDCGAPLQLKARGSRSFRTLFGTFKVDSPRLESCDCTRRKTSSFRPLAALLTEPVTPELLEFIPIKSLAAQEKANPGMMEGAAEVPPRSRTPTFQRRLRSFDAATAL